MLRLAQVIGRSHSLMATAKPDVGTERFKHAIQQARWEMDLLWRIHATFLVPLIFLLGFSLQAAVSGQTSPDARWLVVIALLLGVFLCVPWYAISQRSQSYYDFRIAQARDSEPDDWNLIAGDGQKFSRGEAIRIGDTDYQTDLLGRRVFLLRSRNASRILVGFVLAMYLVGIGFTGYWAMHPPRSAIGPPFPVASSYPFPVPSAASYPLPVSSGAPYPFPVPSPSAFPWPYPSPILGK